MMTEEMLRSMIRSGRRTALDGIVCTQRIIEGGVSTLHLHAAIRMEKDEFAQDGTGDRNLHRLAAMYQQLDTHMGGAMLNFSHSSYVDEYGIFTFTAPEEYRCLADLPMPLEPQAALEIFAALLNILHTYRRCAINKNGYRPLLCICRDSVYLDISPDGQLNGVRLLPLLYDPQTAYEGLPREIFRDKTPDVSADVHMAAYLYLLLKYTDVGPFDPHALTVCDALAEQCLSPFVLRRPPLDQLLHAAQNDQPLSQAEEDSHLRDDTPAFVVIDEEEDAVVPIFKGKGRLLDAVKKKLDDSRQKRQRRTVGEKDRFDLFSTEQADESEDNT